MKDDESKAGTFSQEQKPESILNGHRETLRLCLNHSLLTKTLGSTQTAYIHTRVTH